ncbi:MAG: cupin domain-containing protein [Nitrospinae bacterium]|nr:cupin domain-containing protein [Nitrospinota bacterium]
MPFHRFDEIEKKAVTPHLSSGQGSIIEGEYMYFCQVSKVAGTGSQIHYHPNELMIFPVSGKINALVGKDRRVVTPGTFVHVPAYAQHQMGATEDGDMDYLYVKDRSWTVVGLDRDQVVPDKALTVEEINQRYEEGTAEEFERDAERSEIIVEGLNNSYYPILPSLDAPASSGRHTVWIEGERLAFGYGEIPEGFEDQTAENAHEQFVYVIKGVIDAQVDDDRQQAGPGSIIHIPKGSKRSLSAQSGQHARYASVRAMPKLEEMLREKAAAAAAQG